MPVARLTVPLYMILIVVVDFLLAYGAEVFLMFVCLPTITGVVVASVFCNSVSVAFPHAT